MKENGWISDDISFCMNGRCKRTSCFRNPKNIRYPEIPHSFAQFAGTDECPKNRKKGDSKK